MHDTLEAVELLFKIIEPSLLFLFLLFVLSNRDALPFSSKINACYLAFAFFIVAVRLGVGEWQLSKYLTTDKALIRVLLSLGYFLLLVLSTYWIPSRKMLSGFILILFILHFGLGHNQLVSYQPLKAVGLETSQTDQP